MAARAFIVMMAFLFSACATNMSQAPQLPKVQMQGNKFVEPGYGYSLEIPTDFTLVDETFLAKLDPAKREKFLSDLAGSSSQGLRAVFFNSSNSSFLMITCTRSIYATKQDSVKAGRTVWKSWVTAQNSQGKYKQFFDLEFDRYERLTDLNFSMDTDTGFRMLAYLCPYNFRGSLYEQWLLLVAPLISFDSALPIFYSCIKSLKLPDQIPKQEGQERKEPISVRLEKLKRLKDSGLISEQDYEKKKGEMLNEL